MKAIRFGRHARRAVVFWGIRQEDIESTLSAPDRVLPTKKVRLNAIKQFGNRFLRVTYREEPDYLLVITVTPRKRPW